MPAVIRQMSPEDLKEYTRTRQEKEYVLVDVRQPEEYRNGHIPGAFLLPLPELQNDPSRLPEEGDIIFYCRSGARSMAAATLAADTVKAKRPLHSLTGGITAWQGKTLAGFPRVRVFDRAGDLPGMLFTAMDMEKGAGRFYKIVSARHPDKSFTQAFEKLSEAEKNHSETVYNYWKTFQKDPVSFEQLFESLEGGIIEGGETLEEVVDRLDSIEGDWCISLLELALDMEYSAFDLYRTAAYRIHAEKPREAVEAIAQAEKGHMHILAQSLARCSG